jgi:flagellar hook protein FlgE
MSITSAMNAGVMGLAVNSTKLATISDNIANSATKGYKRADVEFSALVLDGSPTSYTAGGVRSNPLRMVDQRGSVTSTRNGTDLAIGGPGFIPVIDESALFDGGTPPVRLTTTGSFRPDANGYLKTATGQVLMGWPAVNGAVIAPSRESFDSLVPVQLDASNVSNQPTTELSAALNLPANATGAGAVVTDAYPVSISYYDSLGGSETLSIIFYPTTTENEWRMQVLDSASNQAGATPGLLLEADVVFVAPPAANAGALDSITVDGATTHGAGISYDPITGLFDLVVERPLVGDPGRPITLDLGLPNLPDDALGADADTDPDRIITAAQSRLKQLESDFVISAVDKNGSPAAVMTGVEVSSDGLVSAVYDTGLRETLYQIPVAMVRNPNGLEALDNQTYKLSYNSGDVYFYDAGDGPTGTIISSALEESTTDIAEELTQMIRTQRAYSSNAKVIQTSDEMLQETTNLKR